MKIIFCAMFVFLAACSDETNLPGLISDGIKIPVVNPDRQNSIKIASFNIAELGNSKRTKDFKAIAQMINEFDLIALQEVQDKGGEAAVMSIHAALNAISGNRYALPLVIPNAGRGFPGIEGYAFIYRDPVQLDNRVFPVHGFRYDNNHDIYGRVPALAHFKAGTFDFIVATVHLQWDNIDRRQKEMIDIKKWLIEFANRDTGQERDLIIVGDFNRYGNLSNTVIEQHQAPFDTLIDLSELGKTYRLISLEFLLTTDTQFADSDERSTTTGVEKNLYDQIMISAGSFREHKTTPSLFGEDVGVIAFDMEDPWKEKTNEEIKDAVSDHRPIWARFQINLVDDDGPDFKE